MSTDTTLEIRSTKLEDTLALGASVGERLIGGEVIELISDLGGGKTSFVKGLAEGMGSKDQIASPTFTISREYKAGELELHHFDFYRLDDPGIIANELEESISDPKTVVAIEWSGAIKDSLPEDRLAISIKSTGKNERRISLAANGKRSAALIEGLA